METSKITKLLNPLYCIFLNNNEIVLASYDPDKAEKYCKKLVDRTGDDLKVKCFNEIERSVFVELMRAELIK